MTNVDTTLPAYLLLNQTRKYTKVEALSEAQNHRCGYCGVRFSGARWDAIATVDHVKPVSLGGLRVWENEVMACILCNSGRGAMLADDYFEMVQELGRAKAAEIGRRREGRPPLPKLDELPISYGERGDVRAPQFGMFRR